MAVWAIFVGMLAVSALLTALIAWTLSFHGRRPCPNHGASVHCHFFYPFWLAE
jgi:hypothetical protein